MNFSSVIGGYYVLLAGGAWVFPEGVARSLLVGPMFFLLPMGIGLWLAPPRTVSENLGLGRLELTALAFFTGALCLVVVFVARERGMLMVGSSNLWMWGALVMSGFGLIRFFRLGNGFPDKSEFLYALAAAYGVFAPLYFLHFNVFSRYPYTDLFQYTHLMKGANEFARFDRLNPFTADSYMPLWQATLGILRRLFDVELLNEFWVLPWITLPFRTIIYYALARKLFARCHERIFFVAALVASLGYLPPTNGDLAVLGTLLILALLMPHPTVASTFSRASLGFAVVSAGVGIGYLLTTLTLWMVLVLVIGIAAGLWVNFIGYRSFCQWAVLLQASLVMAPLHRSTLVFLPLAAGIVGWRAIASRWPRACTAITVIVCVLLFAGIVAILAVHMRFRPSAEQWYWVGSLLEKFYPALSFHNSEAVLGAGSKVALFEIAHSVGAWLALAVLLPGGGSFGGKRGVRQDGHTGSSLWLFGAAALLVLIILVGIPFIHRTVFLVVTLLVAVWTTKMYDQRQEHRYLLLSIAFIVVALSFAYGMPYSLGETVFMVWVKPYILGGAAVLIALTLFYVVRRTNRCTSWIPTMVLIGTLLFERVLTHTYFMPYVYGETVVDKSSKVVAHYDHVDLEVARWLQRHDGRIVLVSDPVTMANLRALTGLNSIMTFSNLDTMPPTAKHAIMNLLRSVVMDSSSCYEGKIFKKFLAEGAFSSELNYELFRALHADMTGGQVLAVFDYNGGLIVRGYGGSGRSEQTHGWIVEETSRADGPPAHAGGGEQTQGSIMKETPLFTVVITSRTYQWLQRGRLHLYLNGLEPLPTDLIQMLQNQCKAVVFGEYAIIVPVHGNKMS